MKRTGLLFGMALAAALGLGTAHVLAQDAKKSDRPQKPEDGLAAMMKLGAPGPGHKNLEPLAGTWNAKAKFWMDPSKPPDQSEGVCERKWILGGRFLQEVYQGKAMGQPFKGIGMIGFDNFKKKYVTMWVDSMSTALQTTEGTYDPAKKTFTFHNEGMDPYTGQKMKSRDVTRLVSPDKQLVEMYKQTPDGKEIKILEIVYTRKK
jgi:hypothetical protein